MGRNPQLTVARPWIPPENWNPGDIWWTSGSPSGILEWPETGTFFDAGWRSSAAMSGMAELDAAWPP